MVKVGDKIETWFSDREDGMSTVLEILPYDGLFTDLFNCMLVVTAPRTRSSTLKLPYLNEEVD